MDVTILEELKKDQFKPLYLLYGEESYFIEKTIQAMKDRMLHPDWSDFNYTSVDLTKTPIEVAIQEAENFPFGEGRRLIIAHNALFLTATNKSSVEHSMEALLALLEQPTDFSSLVLIVPQNKLDERKKVVKELLKRSRVLHATPLSPLEWENWINKCIIEKGIALDRSSMDILIRYLPNNLQMVENELEKLSLYVHNRHDNRIEADELKKVISRTVEGDVFDLVEKIVSRNFQAAFEIYYELTKQNEEPIKILALLARQFRMILQSKVMSKEGYSQKQIAAQLKVHPYPIKIAVEQGKRFSEEELVQIITHIADLDYQIKTGQREKQFGLELLLLRIQVNK